MCRFTFYMGPKIVLSSLLTEPSHSLIKQSYLASEREEPLNGDGFGVAYFTHLSERPAVFRSISPAWSNANLQHLARVTESQCIVAHVRAATQGLTVTETNCHPFSWQKYAMVHNGDVGGFQKIRRYLLQELGDVPFHMIQGSTDSEHLFAVFLEMLSREKDITDPTELMVAALQKAIRFVLDLGAKYAPGEPSYLNVAVTDGHRGVVTRFTTDAPENADSLYLHTGRRYVCEDGLCRMIDPEAGDKAVLVASEPLSKDPGWQSIPVNHLVVIHPDRKTETRAVCI